MTSARIRTEQLRKAHGSAARITWLIYKKGYVERSREDGANHIQTIMSRARQLNARLVWYDTTKEVISYLNRGLNRRKVKIATFDFFGHSNKFCFLLDYSNEILGASRCFLHQRRLNEGSSQCFRQVAAYYQLRLSYGRKHEQRMETRHGNENARRRG